MPTPITVKTEDVRTTAFRWLVRVLKADPALSREIRNWWVWDGTTNTSGELPIEPVTVRLTPRFEPERLWASAGPGARVYRAPVTVQIEQSTPGNHANNPGNLAGLILTAAHAAFQADREGAKASGVSWIEECNPSQIAGDNPVAVGALRLAVFITR